MVISLTQVKSALVSTLLMALLAVATYIIQARDVRVLDFWTLINIVIISLSTGVVSFVKSVLTTDEGNFVGLVKVK